MTRDTGDGRNEEQSPDWRTEGGAYLEVWQIERLHRFGYLTDDERDEMREVGIATIETADGDEVTLCPDMELAPSTVGPLIDLLGQRTEEVMV